MTLTVELLAAAAMRVEEADPIDFAELSIREEDAFVMMSRHVIEMLKQTPPEQHNIIMAASVVKLLVENFVLQMQVMQLSFHKKG